MLISILFHLLSQNIKIYLFNFRFAYITVLFIQYEHIVSFSLVKYTQSETWEKLLNWQKMIISIIIAEMNKCYQCAQSAIWKRKCGRKRSTNNRDDITLKKIVKQTRFKNMGEWSETGVSAPRATMQRRLQEIDYNRCFSSKPPHVRSI